MNTRIGISIGILLISLLVGGCETTKTARYGNAIPEALRSKMGNVEIAHRDGPEVEIRGVTRNKMQGAGKGALGGAIVGANVALQGGPWGIFLVPSFAAAGAGSGVIVGAVVADKAENVKNNVLTAERVAATADDRLREALEGELKLLSGWEYGISEYVLDSEERRNTHFDSRIEIQLEHLAASGEAITISSDISFQWTSVARLYLGDSDLPMLERRYRFETPVHYLAKWAKDDGRLLEEELSRLSHLTAERIVDEFFRQGSIFIDPVYPATKRPMGTRRIKTLNPVLKWETMDGGGSINSELASSISYSLVLQERDGERHRFDNLAANHLEVNLEPGAVYEWRVQGSYTVRGQERVTPWSAAQRFRTPK